MRVLVTGSNRGIGLAMCKVLSERGDEVLAACRTLSPALETLDVLAVPGVDVGDPASRGRLEEAIGSGPIHLVVANAARNESFDIDHERPEDLDLDLFEGDLRVNLVGAMRTVLTALPSMPGGSRILLVSSGASSPGLGKPGSFGYKITKSALNQFGRQLAESLASRRILVATVSPGPTNTAMLQATFARGRTQFDPAQAPPAAESARRMLATAESTTAETSGSFWAHTGETSIGPDGRAPV